MPSVAEAYRTPSAPSPEPRRRLRGDARRAAIIDAAVSAFAQHGFQVSTRELAARLGVTQALLYRYFPSKEAIIDAVIERFARRRWPSDHAQSLINGPGTLEERLVTFYVIYIDNVPADGLRLFLRASLDGEVIGTRFGPLLTEDVLRPVVAALRRESDLPSIEIQAMINGERELAMSLHGSVVWLLYRRHIFSTPIPDSPADLIRLRVRAFLPGGLSEFKALHGEHVLEPFAIPYARPKTG